MALLFVPFTCMWSVMSVGNIFIRPFFIGQPSVIPISFGIPFLLGSVILIAMCLMSLGGKVEVERDGDDGKVFVGFWEIGWSRRFKWSGIDEIREDRANNTGGVFQWNRNFRKVILIEGETRIAFGSGLSGERRYFLLQGLKRLRMAR